MGIVVLFTVNLTICEVNHFSLDVRKECGRKLAPRMGTEPAAPYYMSDDLATRRFCSVPISGEYMFSATSSDALWWYPEPLWQLGVKGTFIVTPRGRDSSVYTAL